MKELIDAYLPPFITDYVYVPYMLCVWLIVEWVRYEFDNIDSKMKPKHLTLIVGIIVGIAFYFGEKFFEGIEIPHWMLIVSYFVTTFLYEYAIKPIKEKFFAKFSDKQKQ